MAVTAILAISALSSCVLKDEDFGQNFISANRKFDIGVETFPLKGLRTERSDSLSGFNSYRFCIGAIRTADAAETRSTAFTLVPIYDEIDFGETDPTNIRFHFTAVKDTVSVADEGQENIIQNINVYALTETLDEDYMYSDSKPVYDPEKITLGTPLYAGGDSLSFNFTEKFALKYIEAIKNMGEDDFADPEKYAETLPGIYISTDTPTLEGGRINMFGIPVQTEDSYYVSGNYAELAFTSRYDGKDVDTSFIFLFGPQTKSLSTNQYALNVCTHEFSEDRQEGEIPDGQSIRVDGGSGFKPVVSAKSIRNTLLEELAKKGIDPASVIINKATLVFPFEFPEDYNSMTLYPQYLSPTSKISGTVTDDDGNDVEYATYAGLTDASIDTENQGDVNRSLCQYAPDISHHLQQILRLGDDAKFADYDIWMMIMADETITESSSSSELDDYYQNLAYANYYNSMYDPYGYGGYGYGGYYGSYGGYGYSNYYNYYNYMQYANSSQETTSVVTQLDKDRYYNCVLNGPDSEKEKDNIKAVPHMTVVYSYIRPAEE